MLIKDIYRKFNIPINLQEHMFRVFSIVCWLEQNWGGDFVDWHQVKKMALLHDLGNIVKFDFNNHLEFLGDERKNLDFWKDTQKRIIKKYGPNDDKATRKMLQELKIDNQIIETIYFKRFSNSVNTLNSNDWPLKILYYADLRTLPFGIGTLEERLVDAKNRMPQYNNRPDFKDLIIACKKIEIQIQTQVKVSLKNINNNLFEMLTINPLDFGI